MKYVPLFVISIIIFISAGCGETEREREQQQQYEAQLQQQMIETTESFRSEIAEVLDLYFKLKDIFIESDSEQAAMQAETLVERTESVDISGLTEETTMVWASFADLIISAGDRLTEYSDVDEQRIHFEEISETMIHIVDTFQPVEYEVFVQSCPMFRDDSAEWLSREEQIKNPYFGDRMLRCGEVIRRIN